MDSQGSHACQTEERPVCELADVVPLEFQNLQDGKTLKGQAFDQAQPVPAQVPVEKPRGSFNHRRFSG